MRRARPQEPKARAPIQADVCLECDPGDGGGGGGGGGGSDPYFATARNRPQNETGQPGVDLGSRNYNWSLPLVGLPGRAGFDLDISINYNSLIWTKQGNTIMFNADRGFPTAGFRLGVPRLEATSMNQDEQVTAMMLVMPSGQRIALMQVGTSNVFESQDSSYVQAIDTTGYFTNVLVRTTDGTQYTFNSGYCSQIKDRNGNYASITYYNGQVSTITDTLGRVVTFNYAGDYLSSITQTWNGQTHTWATFGYTNIQPNTNFPSMSYIGPLTPVTMLTQISLDDGSYYVFNYTTWLQVYRITHYAPNGAQLSYTSYNLPLNNSVPHYDCPRFTERRDWATHWNNDQEAVTTYSVDPNSAGGEQPAWTQMTTPDGVTYKELFATTGWQKGLTIGTEVWVGGVKKKWTTTEWTQDDTSLSYQKNARPYDMSIYDEGGNRRRTDIIYHAAYGLPYVVREYAADGVTIMRQTYTDYNLSSVYTDRRIIGLVLAVHVVDENGQYVSKTVYNYDWGGEYMTATSQPATQHDAANYGASFITGRGNLTGIYRFDVTDINNTSKAILTHIGYNTTGSVVWTRDALGHQTSTSYTDSFSDGIGRNTYAYPTTLTDADNYSSTKQYDYNFGGVTRTQNPKGAAVSVEYDVARRPTRVTNLNNNSYKRWVYADGQDYTLMFETIDNLGQEYYSFTWNDGGGRIHGAGGSLPNSAGGYYVRKTVFDVMGRAVQMSNPTEITGGIIPAGDDSAAGFVWQQQQYDWKGRPTILTNPDGTTRELSYNVCGCAGSEVVTVRDERGRRRRLTNDVFGRLKRVEELNFDQSVYSTTEYSYNARNQITYINQAGQGRLFEYDGYGRLWRRTTPEQGQTTYTYFADDTLQSITDARGAAATYGYNNRHLLTSITYGVPAGVEATSNVLYGYDEAGNRTSMTDGLGTTSYQYNTLSRLTSETRSFNGLGSYTLSYSYNLAGELASVTGPSQFGSINVSYAYDYSGRASTVTGSGYGGVSSYAGNFGYRAWGGLKQVTYGNSRTLSISYDNRLRMTKWDVIGVTGSNYAYDTPNIHELTNRVAYADHIYDPSLDRSYDYDQVGRLWASHTGGEAMGHAGYSGWGPPYGPYAQNYAYDSFGNMTWRNGWGAPNSQYSYNPQFINNRMMVNPVTGAAMQYDAAGNLLNDGQQAYTYDATGQQITASGTGLSQSYDGDAIRVRKVESGVTTYYLRSSVLSKQVVAEINGNGTFKRGYVYLGRQMLATQESNQVNWVHQDPVTKSQVLTNTAGTPVSWVELDPWGGETGRSNNSQLQPHRYTTYERDANGGDEAMLRRYESKWQRFAQPDPFEGSYDLANPQSFNRYAYAQDDGVNYIDPSGLMPCVGAQCGWGDVSAGFWGGGWDFNDRPHAGRRVLIEGEASSFPWTVYHNFHLEGQNRPFVSMFADWMPWGGFQLDRKAILQAAINRVKDRFKSTKSCRELFDNIDPNSVLDNDVFFGNHDALGDPMGGRIAVSNEVYVGSQRFAAGVITINESSFFFTGQISQGGQMTNIMDVLTPQIRGLNGLGDLNFNELQELILLHELMHINDTAGRHDDPGNANPGLNNLIIASCFRL